jgi:hypothetical protein
MATQNPPKDIGSSRDSSPDAARRSDRVQVSLSIEVIGTDYQRGQPFCHAGRTVTVSLHGAAIALNYALAADQEFTVRCIDTGQEAVARVVGPLYREGETFVYGVGFVDTAVNPWGIEFPATDTGGLGRALLACRGCQTAKVFHLNEIELQVFSANESIQQFCKSCSATTSWQRENKGSTSRPGSPKAAEPESPSQQRRERRRHRRVGSNTRACIRELGSLEEVVTCDISRSGLCIRASRRYQEGALIEVAIPYSPHGTGNIFVPARVTRVQDYGQFFKLGVAYEGASGKQRASVYTSGARSIADMS